VDIVHVPYKGGGPASVAMLAGEVQAGFAGYSSLANARAGKLKALATTGSARGAATPDIPTFGEAGYPEVNLVGWFGLLAPAGTPKDIVTRLNTEIVKALRTPEIREKLGGQGIEVIAGTPEAFGKVIATEIPIYGRLVKEAKVRIE
jgi:tripartite-type tricarboxylate transporter receptor subunit TctC